MTEYETKNNIPVLVRSIIWDFLSGIRYSPRSAKYLDIRNNTTKANIWIVIVTALISELIWDIGPNTESFPAS